MKGTILVVFWVALAGAAADTVATEILRGATSALLPEEILSFPRIYTAIVPTKNGDLQSPIRPQNNSAAAAAAAAAFIAQVNVLRAEPYPSEDEEEGNSKRQWRKVSFLVRSQDQLDQIYILASDPSLSVRQISHDTESTKQLYDQIHFHIDQGDDDDDDDDDEVGDGGDNDQVGVTSDRLLHASGFSSIQGFRCYRDLHGSFDTMDSLVVRVESIPHLSLIRNDIGDSWQKTQNPTLGYDMIALNLTGTAATDKQQSDNDTLRTTDKGVLFVMSGIHSREYAPPEMVLRWLEYLIDSYGTDADITSILDHTEIHAVVHSNPDGRRIAETRRDLWWRKSRHCEEDSQCQSDECGVDLNRNFPFYFGYGDGASNNPCSDIYMGAGPASEPETKAIVEYTKAIFPADQQRAAPGQNVHDDHSVDEAYPETNKGVFLDLHAYGNMLIYPWGFEEKMSGNDQDFRVMTGKLRHFNGYDFTGPFNGFSYEVSGGSKDYGYGMLGAAAYVFELGTTFYEKCSVFKKEIVPTNLQVLTYAAKVSKAPFSLPKGPDITKIDLSKTVVANSLTIEATASDSQWASGHHDESKQSIQEILVYVDAHPDDCIDGSAPSALMMQGTMSSLSTVVGTLILDVSSLSSGRHTLYLQAKDTDGYKGPVTAVYFEKKRRSSSPRRCVDDSFAIFSVDSWSRNCQWLSMRADSDQKKELCTAGRPPFEVCRLTCDNCADG